MGPAGKSGSDSLRQGIETQKLMVSGSICPVHDSTLPAEISRGMPIVSVDGVEVGKVAAVVVTLGQQYAGHILLGRLPDRKGYWMVSVNLIKTAVAGKVQLSIPADAVDSLPVWHST